MIQDYTEAKVSYAQTLQDAEEIEKRAHDTGVELVKAQEELDLLRGDLSELRDEKVTNQDTVKEILRIITAKDSEFQGLDGKLKDTLSR